MGAQIHEVAASTPHPSLPHKGGGVTANFFLYILKEVLARNSVTFRRYGCGQFMENLFHLGIDYADARLRFRWKKAPKAGAFRVPNTSVKAGNVIANAGLEVPGCNLL
jgi:hypothetical protein